MIKYSWDNLERVHFHIHHPTGVENGRRNAKRDRKFHCIKSHGIAYYAEHYQRGAFGLFSPPFRRDMKLRNRKQKQSFPAITERDMSDL